MAQKDQTQAVLSTCTSFLKAYNAQNYSQLNSYIAPGGCAALRRNNTQLNFVPLTDMPKHVEEVVKHLYPGKAYEETFDDPVVHVDEDLACVWTRFRFLVEGELTATGSNVLILHRMENGEWKISGIADRNIKVPVA